MENIDKNTQLYIHSFKVAFLIDEHLQKKYEYIICEDDFKILSIVLNYPKTKQGQKNFANFLTTLEPEALIAKIKKVAVLITIINRIQHNSKLGTDSK